MKAKLWYVAMSVMLAGLVFTGCSSSSSDSGTAGPGNDGGATLTPMVAVGAMSKGSVIVNGVRFEDTTANIAADDTPKTPAFLADGMTVKVKGTVNADGVTGAAEKVEVVNEVRGAVAAKGTDTLTVHGQTVLVDGGTVLAGTGVTGIASLEQGENIEVHGGRDDVGVIHATRVERLTGVVVDEVRGPVSGKTATSFAIGGQVFTFDGSTVMVPTGATFADGDVVEVHLSGNAATQIAVEHLDHPEFEPAEGQEISIEGILKGFSASGTFNVGAQEVQLVSGARVEGGVLADLVDGMKVEAEGHSLTAGGALLADKIKIKDNIRIEANAELAGSANVLDKTVQTTTLTKLSSNLTSTAAIAANDGLRIRGFINRDGTTITAIRVDKQSGPVQSDKIIIQGPVSNIDLTGHTFKILGITVSAGSSTSARPNDDSSNDNNIGQISLDSFFSSLTDGLTVVKAKGTFTAGSLSATEIELE